MARKNRIFNSLKRAKLLRKSIPPAEAFAGVVCLVVVIGFGVWVLAQRNTFDPGERDVSIEVLREQSVVDDLYRVPFKPWSEEGVVPMGVANLGPLPAELASAPWRAPGRVKTFTEATLYEKINGQADQYIKFGFMRLDFAELQHDNGTTLDIYLYDQGSFANSLGLFEEQRGKQGIEERSGVLFTRTGAGAYGVAGSTFFQVIASASSQEVKTKTDEILDALSSAGANSAPPPFVVFQEQMAIPVERIGYTPINVFQYSFASDFWFARTDTGDARLYLHSANTETEATDLFNKLKREQVQEFDVVAEDADAIVYQHQYLKTYFTLQRSGPHVFGIDGHPTRTEAEQWTQRLAVALKT